MFACIGNFSLTPNPDEVDQARWWTFDEVTRHLRRSQFTRLFEKQFEAAMHVVLGIVAASTIAIIPTKFQNATSVIISVACAVCGFLISSTCDRLLAGIKPEDEDDNSQGT